MTVAKADDGVRAQAIRGGAVTLLGQGAKLALYVGSGVALARLLSPEDFGLFAIAYAVVGFLEIAKDGGMITPVVQTQALTPEQSSWLFYFNLARGLALALVALVCAPVLAAIFGDARLKGVMAAMALVFLAGGASTQHRALLRRELRFVALTLCEIAALAAGTMVALVAAMRGAGYWSLVAFFLMQEAVQSVSVVAVSGWRPERPRVRADVRHFVGFGGLMMGFEVVGYLTFKFDNLIVAYFLGPTAVGLYDKAYQLLQLPLNQVSTPLSGVILPLLSRLQAEPDRFRTYLSRGILVSAGLGMPVIAFLFADADLFVELVFGPAWLPSAAIFRALAPAAFIVTISVSFPWIFLSLGRARRQLWWQLGMTAITVAGFFCGLPWGTIGVAAAFSATRAAIFIPTLRYTCRGTPIAWRWVMEAAARPACAALVALAVVAAAGDFAQGWWLLGGDAALYALAYGLCWIAMPGGLALMREALDAARSLYRHD